MSLRSELTELLATGAPILHLATYEEKRFQDTVLKLPEILTLGVHSYDDDQLLKEVRPGERAFELTGGNDPIKLLNEIRNKMPPNHILILKDFHHAWRSERRMTSRMLRNMIPGLRAQNQHLILLTPPLSEVDGLPSELRNDVLWLEVPLPDEEEMHRIFQDSMSSLKAADLPAPPLMARMVQAALGLTSNRAGMALTLIWSQFQQFDERAIDTITRFKKDLIRESGALEFWSASEGDASVGGLDKLRDWLKGREAVLTPEAREADAPLPRGVLLIGIPGTGKSMTARMVSGMWKLPLVRLDVAALFGAYLGDSEANMRQAIMLAETVSPCILWIDEVEKAFAGIDPKSINAGAPARVFGSFLTWMQEHTSPVYVLATANDVSCLPPEFYRRFDRTYFLDLPNKREREEIFEIHLKRAKVPIPRDLPSFDELIVRSRGMVGSDIEKVVREAQITAYCDGERELTAEDLLAVLGETVALINSHPEYIEALKKWQSDGRAFPASSDESPTHAYTREPHSTRRTEPLTK